MELCRKSARENATETIRTQSLYEKETNSQRICICGRSQTRKLCVAEAKKDDFAQGRVQCLIEMIACVQQNRQAGYEIDVLGIVSNGQVWQFYKLTPQNCLFETGFYTTEFLPELLGALAYLCDICSAAVPRSAP